MNKYEIHTSGPIKLPDGVSVGDEFQITGRVRVTGIAEDLINTTQFTDFDPSVLPGSRSYTLVLSDVEPA